jgi:hypothetical protein
MSPLWSVVLLVVVLAVWLISQLDWVAWQRAYHVLPPHMMHQMSLLAMLGMYTVWNNLVLLSMLHLSIETSLVPYGVLIALGLLVAYQYR